MINKADVQVNVRMREPMVDAIDGLANMQGMNRSEWICNVITLAIEEERRKYLALNSIFAHDPCFSKEMPVKQCVTETVRQEFSDSEVRKDAV